MPLKETASVLRRFLKFLLTFRQIYERYRCFLQIITISGNDSGKLLVKQ